MGASCGRLGSDLGASWGRLGGVLGASWGVLGRLGASQGHLPHATRRLGAILKLRGGDLASFPAAIPEIYKNQRFLHVFWKADTFLGALLDLRGGALGRSWGSVGASWGDLGAPWGRLGAILGLRESVLASFPAGIPKTEVGERLRDHLPEGQAPGRGLQGKID